MRFLNTLLFGTPALLAAAVSLVSAAPTALKDPAYRFPTATMQAAITCPSGIKKAKGGIVLLVHGTGSTGPESWGSGPYVEILPKLDAGYDVCWINLPSRSMVDIADSGEYVAYAIKYLAPQSATGKVKIVSHSQGGPDTQFALAFFPSTRNFVSHFVGNSPDFHATQVIAALPRLPYLLAESLYQQGSGSHFDKMTYSKIWNTQYVPTLSVYSIEDEVVQPFPSAGTLSGGTPNTVTSIQAYCPLYVADHFLMIIAQPAFALTASWFATGTIPTKAQFNPARCFSYPDGSITDFRNGVPLATAVLADVLTVAAGYKAQGEPKFQPYVCAAGAAASSDCGDGYFPPSLFGTRAIAA